ncbi:phage late control protein GPD [compost metagenome]
MQRGVANFSITLARGRPDLFPELPAVVSGWKPQIDNTGWTITKVTHHLSDRGYTTTLELEIKPAGLEEADL